MELCTTDAPLGIDEHRTLGQTRAAAIIATAAADRAKGGPWGGPRADRAVIAAT